MGIALQARCVIALVLRYNKNLYYYVYHYRFSPLWGERTSL